MIRNPKTRWYQSLTIRLLALFWFLLLGASTAALYGAYYFTQPTPAEPLAEDFERSLPPVFEAALGSGLLQPGRLLVGEYRVMARLDDTALEPTFAPALHPDYIGYILRLFEEPEAQQVPVGDKMLAGPFTIDNAFIIVARPLLANEMGDLAAKHDQDWLPRVVWLSVGFSGFGALILGLWFVRPLRKLRNATREIAEGAARPNLGRLPKRRDELGELARTLSITAIELATSRNAQRRLLSDVSHELRSPLARSQIALDLLGDVTETIRDNPNYRQIEKDIYRLGTIIDSILWLSRLENGLDEPVRQSVELMPLFEDIKADLGYAQAKWEERLQLPTNPLPEMYTDPVLLRLVLENLIRNGFQYGPEQGIVYLTAEEVTHAKGKALQMVVRDEGPGVDESKLKQLFKPFFRADPSRHHGAGVGLGLAICQRATRVLGGELTAKNHPQGGLLATLTVPLK
ncbi:sensor histidine kinase [Aliidiomarina quisquiliarum]|uniref:sensor histidine kinase n=1 Tax=Aliidiomarina quisquiliarum TaxID=2938947 RepID=UPI00208F2D7A|nr:HAMP domain-containing sensor histidine kinase [Aliidiomarina quisquiliarum]MCO4322575.1 HAMP domain-containing histidine kinase [Aliidiomarina quisquiliarum]